MDTTPPQISLPSGVDITHQAGVLFAPDEATAQDSLDGAVPLTVEGDVDILPAQVPMAFVLTYTATDAAGNTVSITQTVTVVDTSGPAMTLILTPMGGTTVRVPYGTEFRDPGVEAEDAAGLTGDFDRVAQVPGRFDVTTPGAYNVTYTATDIYGNTAIAVRTVVVEPFELPGPGFIHRMLLDIPHERRPPLEQLQPALVSSVGNGFVFIVTDRPEAAGGDDFNRLSLYIGAPSEVAEGSNERRRRREARARTVIDWVARNATTLDWIPSSRLRGGAEEVVVMLNITLVPPTPAVAAEGGGSQSTAAAAAGVVAGVLALAVLVLLVVRLRRQRQLRVANSIGTKSAPRSAVFGKRDRMALAREDIYLGPRLGHFAAGDVFEARILGDTHGGEACLAIVADDSTGGGYPALAAEVRIAQAMSRHPNILLLTGRCAQARPPVAVLAPAAHGSLWHFLRRARRGEAQLSPAILLQLATGTAAGLEAVHLYQITHRNLSSRSVVVAEGVTGFEAKIADFAAARHTSANDDGKQLFTSPLSPRWQAPEVLRGEECSNMSDVWSLGVTLWEIFTLAATPYYKLPDSEIGGELERRNRLPPPKTCSSDLYKELLLQMWRSQAESRMSVRQVAARLRRETAVTQMPDTESHVATIDFENLEPVATFDELDSDALLCMTGFEIDARGIHEYAGAPNLTSAVVVSPRSDALPSQMYGLGHNPAYVLAEPSAKGSTDGGWMTHNPAYMDGLTKLPVPVSAEGAWLDGDGGYNTISISSAPSHNTTTYDTLASREPSPGAEYTAFGDGHHRSSGASAPSYNRMSRMEDDRYQVTQVPPCVGIYTGFGGLDASAAESSSRQHGEQRYSHLDRERAATGPHDTDLTYAEPSAPAPYSLSLGRTGRERTSRRLAAVTSRDKAHLPARRGASKSSAETGDDWDAEV